MAALDQHADGDVVGDAVEERVLAPVQQPAVEPVGRRGEADHLQVRVGGAQPVEQPPVLGVARARHQVRLVDDGEIDMPEIAGAPGDRLHAGDEDLAPELALAEPGRVDARRGVGPEPDQRRVVLRDQLAHVGDDQDAGLGVGHHRAAGELGEDHALARAGRRDHQRRAAAGAEPGVERVDRRALVVAQLDHAARPWHRRRRLERGEDGADRARRALALHAVLPDRDRGQRARQRRGGDAVLQRDRDHDAGVVDEGRHRRAGLLAVGEHLERPPGVVVADADGEGLAAKGDVADGVATAVRKPGPRHRSPAFFQVRCAM